MKRNQLAEELVSLTVFQINELSKILKEKYGIEDLSLTTKHQNSAQNNRSKEKVKTPGNSKLAGHGLKDYKELVDKVPSIIKSNLKKAEAELLIKEFDQLGALAELK